MVLKDLSQDEDGGIIKTVPSEETILYQTTNLIDGTGILKDGRNIKMERVQNGDRNRATRIKLKKVGS